MSFFWQRLFGRKNARGRSKPPEPLNEETQRDNNSAEDLRLIEFAPDQDARLPVQRRLQELLIQAESSGPAFPTDTDEILPLIGELVRSGGEAMALELLTRLTIRLPNAPALQLRLAEMYVDRREVDRALALLQSLTEEPSCRLRAHYLLGEHHAQEGELKRALLHYERVLALDFNYPRTLARVEMIKSQLRDTSIPTLPTIFGAEDLGPGARYTLQRELGRGGWGTVYLAHDRQLNRPVAVKMLHSHVRRRPAACLHLFCEARIAASLRHPGIITIYDLDEALALIVMEYCPGGTLAHRITKGALPPNQALRILADLAGILDTVHRYGVVHKDVKPANLLSRDQGGHAAGHVQRSTSLVLSDFGIAHVEGEAPEGPGGSGSLIYMAPEQRQGMADDPRADLYSTGILLLEMLLGRPPQSPAHARQGIPLSEMGPLWEEVEDLFPRVLQQPFLAMARGLVAPARGNRTADAKTLYEQSSALAEAAATFYQDLELIGLGDHQRNPDQQERIAHWLEGLPGAGSH